MTNHHVTATRRGLAAVLLARAEADWRRSIPLHGDGDTQARLRAWRILAALRAESARTRRSVAP